MTPQKRKLYCKAERQRHEAQLANQRSWLDRAPDDAASSLDDDCRCQRHIEQEFVFEYVRDENGRY